jgi:S1-C subfamily serine protease
MKICNLSIFFALLIALCVPSYASQEADAALKAIIKIHSIFPENARSASLLGTEREGNGVVIDSNGHILTIGYLVTGAKSIEVFVKEDQPIKATFVGYDYHTGFGIIKANKPLNITPMQLGRSSEVTEGDPVLVVSHGGSDAVQGVRVVSRGEFAGYWEYILEDAIYTAPPHAKFGGAALVGRDGRLLGIGSIYTQLIIPDVGLVPCNMSVPIDRLKPILADLISSGRSPEPPRPWLGVHAEEAYGRVIVLRTTAGSPAEKAGLQPTDVILTVNKHTVNGLADFYRKVWDLGKPGVKVPLSILQGNKVRNLTVHSGDRYQFLKK